MGIVRVRQEMRMTGVTLELSVDEARWLRALVGVLSGPGDETPYIPAEEAHFITGIRDAFSDRLFDALGRAGISMDAPDTLSNMTVEMAEPPAAAYLADLIDMDAEPVYSVCDVCPAFCETTAPSYASGRDFGDESDYWTEEELDAAFADEDDAVGASYPTDDNLGF